MSSIIITITNSPETELSERLRQIAGEFIIFEYSNSLGLEFKHTTEFAVSVRYENEERERYREKDTEKKRGRERGKDGKFESIENETNYQH